MTKPKIPMPCDCQYSDRYYQLAKAMLLLIFPEAWQILQENNNSLAAQQANVERYPSKRNR